MNSADKIKTLALLVAGLIGTWGMFVMGWCAMFKIYVDTPMLLVLSNIVTGIASSITTILVGRSIAQLNQTDQPIPTEIKQPPDKPVPVVEQKEPTT